MWVTSSLPNANELSFRNTYLDQIKSFLGNTNLHDSRRPILVSPYDWNALEQEIQYQMNPNGIPPPWYPTLPNYPVEDTPEGRKDRLRFLLYGIEHMTQDAVKVKVKAKLNNPVNSGSTSSNMIWIWIVLLLLLLLFTVYWISSKQ
jgi:hypothetical protein